MPEPHLTTWQLARDGDVITTPRGQLYPVRLPDGTAAMLKVSTDAEERNGHRLLRWWDGDGAAHVLAHDGPALLMERAVPGDCLRDMSIQGGDAQATSILCGVLERLHRPRGAPPDGLLDLNRWFSDLLTPSIALSPLLEQCRSLAMTVLEARIEARPLHGDLHHENVLDFGARGWLAIDPKPVQGDRAFDYTVLFTNPDLCGPGIRVATGEEVFEHRLQQVCGLAGLDRPRLLRWIAASAGLSAVWLLADGDTAAVNLAVAAMAVQRLAEASG